MPLQEVLEKWFLGRAERAPKTIKNDPLRLFAEPILVSPNNLLYIPLELPGFEKRTIMFHRSSIQETQS